MKSVVNKVLGSHILCEPITLGGAALIAGGTALANWLFSSSQQSSNVSKSKQLMDYQMMKQKEYQNWLNSTLYPQQVASMRQAGLNPAMMYGSGGMSAPTAQAPNGSSNMSAPKLEMLDAAQAMSNMELLNAQKENIEADTEQKKANTGKIFAETDLLDKQNLTFLDEWSLKMQKLQADTNRQLAGTVLDTELANKTKQEISYLATAEDELLSKIGLNFAQTKFTQEQSSNYNNYIQSVIAQNFAQATYMSNEDKRQGQKLMYECFNMSSLTRLNESQSNLLDVNKKLSEWSLKMQKRYGDVQNIVGIATDIVKTAASATSAGGMLMMGLSSFNKTGQNPLFFNNNLN